MPHIVLLSTCPHPLPTDPFVAEAGAICPLTACPPAGPAPRRRAGSCLELGPGRMAQAPGGRDEAAPFQSGVRSADPTGLRLHAPASF